MQPEHGPSWRRRSSCPWGRSGVSWYGALAFLACTQATWILTHAQLLADSGAPLWPARVASAALLDVASPSRYTYTDSVFVCRPESSRDLCREPSRCAGSG
jgi:hypothetical protein